MPRVSTAKREQSPVVVNVATQNPPADGPAPVEEKPQLEPNWFFDKLNALAPETWQQHTLEIHRLEPKLPGVPGSKGFLDVYTEPVTKAFIKQKFGGGKFRLVLLKNSRYQTSHDFDIEGDPIYSRGRELSPEGANGSGMESRLLNMLESNLKEMKTELRERQATGNSDPALEKSINMLSTTYTTALDSVQKEKANPTQLLKDLVGTAKELGLGFATPAAANHPEANLLNKLIEAAIPMLIAALKPKTLAEQVAEFEAMDKILGGRGGEGRPRDWKATLADRLGEAVPTIIERLQTTPQRRAGMPPRPSVPPNGAPPATPAAPTGGFERSPTGAWRQAPAPPPAPPLRVVPQTSTAGGRDNPESAGNGNTGADSPAVEVLPAEEAAKQQALAEELAYVRGVKKRVVRVVAFAVGDGDDGARIVDFLETAWPEAVNQLEMFTAEQITAYFAEDAILREAVDNPRWPSILAEAQAYLREDVPAETVTH